MPVEDAKTRTCLHLLAAAGREALESCSAHCQPGDTVLLIDAGVLQLLKPELAELLGTGCRVGCLTKDLRARGISTSMVSEEVEPVDDTAFPGLLREHEHCLSWT